MACCARMHTGHASFSTQLSRHHAPCAGGEAPAVARLCERASTWENIRSQVRNLRGEQPSISLMKRVYKGFNQEAGRRLYTVQVQEVWSPPRQSHQRRAEVSRAVTARPATSVCLHFRHLAAGTACQEGCAAGRVCHPQAAATAKVFLASESTEAEAQCRAAAERLRFAQGVVQLSRPRLREKLAFSMDGSPVLTSS